MDTQDIIQRVTQNFNSELQETLLDELETYDISTYPSEQPKCEDMCITVFAKPVTPKVRKKYKSKTSTTELDITFVVDTEFDLEKLAARKINPSKLIFLTISLEADSFESSVGKIKFWSRILFKAAERLYRDKSLQLVLFPFEIYFDTSNNIYISRLPEFKDLRFLDSKKTLVNNADYLNDQVTSYQKAIEFLESTKG